MHPQPDLIVRRHVLAPPEIVFDAWTEPGHLVRWWGPKDIECTHAEVDLRIGGRFRMANRASDGTTVWISGTYEEIHRPELLRHTWVIESARAPVPELVTIEFRAAGKGTEITITHTAIATKQAWDGHEQGWFGCLDGLVELLSEHPA